MKDTFFLGESTHQKVSYITESAVNEAVLQFQNSVLESEINYQEIYQEAMLTEAHILMEEDKAKDGKFKENLKKFFLGMVNWFKGIAKKVADFVTNIVDKVRNRLQGLLKALKDTANKALAKLPIKIKTNYPTLKDSASFDRLKTYYSKAAAGIAGGAIQSSGMEEAKNAITEYTTELEKLKVDKAVELSIDGKYAEGIVSSAESLISVVIGTSKAIVKTCQSGIRVANKAISDTKGDSSTVTRAREIVTGLRQLISGTNKITSTTLRIVNAQASKIARIGIQLRTQSEKASTVTQA